MVLKNIANLIIDNFANQNNLKIALFDNEFNLLAKSNDFTSFDIDKVKEVQKTKKEIIDKNLIYFTTDKFDNQNFIVCLECDKNNAQFYKSTFLSLAKCIIQIIHDDKDKESFFKNIINSNVYGLEIDQIARSLYIPIYKKRIAFYIKTNNSNVEFYEIEKELKNKTINKDADEFLIQIEGNSCAIIKENIDSENDFNDVLSKIKNVLSSNPNLNFKISYGSISSSLRNLLKSYKEALLAFEIGETFKKEDVVYSYNDLGLGRLIFQMPIELCKLFLNEAFKSNTDFVIDEELEEEIKAFFKNNLNISETARFLDIHRNTLVYRFDKLKQETGLDIRDFNDAVIFYISIMIIKYIRRKENAFL